MPFSIKDIARELNLSVSTVSRALNNQGRINSTTRKRVFAEAERLNYHPNESARALRDKANKTIGILVPDIGNTFFAQLIKGAEQALWKAGYALLVMSSDENIERERLTLKLLIDKCVSGIILATVDPEVPIYLNAMKQGVPIIFVDNLPSVNMSYDSIAIDNSLAGYKLVRHLMDLGHKKIAMITGNLQETTSSQRHEGYLSALREENLMPNVKSGTFKKTYGYDAMNELLSGKEIPTAVFAANNSLAYGAVQAIREKNMSIPKDISIVCFDSYDTTGLISPQLTTVNQPAEEIGQISAEILIRKMTSKSNDSQTRRHEKLILEPKILFGNSTSKI